MHVFMLKTLLEAIFIKRPLLRLFGLVVDMSASHVVGNRLTSRLGHTKDHHRNGTNCLPACHTCIT